MNVARPSYRNKEGSRVEFTGPITDQGYGLVTRFKVPESFEVQLYQPQAPATNPVRKPGTRRTTETSPS